MKKVNVFVWSMLVLAASLIQVSSAYSQYGTDAAAPAEAPADAPAAMEAAPVVADTAMEAVAEVADENVVLGEVSAVDATAMTLTVKRLADAEAMTYEDVSFSANDTSELMNGENKVALADLKAGDEVSINFTADDAGVKWVKSLWVLGSKDKWLGRRNSPPFL